MIVYNSKFDKLTVFFDSQQPISANIFMELLCVKH